MKTPSYKTIVILFLVFSISCSQKKEDVSFPKFAEYFSPKSNISLDIKNGKFELDNLEFSSDQIFSTPITHGTFYIDGENLVLNGNNKEKYVLKIESEEILTPIKFENLNEEEKFLAWSIYYNNGNEKQNGGWNDNNTKEGVWSYFDKKGKRTQYLV